MSVPTHHAESTPLGGRRWLLLGAFGFLLFLLYVSVIPLTFVAIPVEQAWGAFLDLWRQDVTGGSRVDVASNYLLAIPVGFFWMGLLWPRRSRFLAVLLACVVLLGCVLWSLAVEFAQLFVPGRSPSPSDVVAQLAGAFTGIAVWWIWGHRLWRQFFRSGAAALSVTEKLLWLYLVVLFGYNVMPLDIIVHPVELYHKWKAGHIVLVPFGWKFSDPVAMLYGLGTDIAIWVPPSLLWVLSGRKSAFGAWLWTAMAAVLLEICQLFIQSRVVEVTDALTAALGAGLGAFLATRFLRQRLAPAHAGAPSDAWIVFGIGSGAAVLWFALMAVVFWYPFDFRIDRDLVNAGLSDLARVPFYTYWRGSPYSAVTEALRKVFFFLPFGVAFAIATLPLRGRGYDWLVAFIALGICLGAAGAIEVGQVLLPGRVADSTDMALETLGGLLGFWGANRVFRRGAGSVPGISQGSERSRPQDRRDTSVRTARPWR